MLVGNRQMGPVLISPDTYAVTQNKAVFGTRHVVKNIKADQSIKLVIEIQADQAPNKFLALSWTMVNLFKMIDCNLQKGMIKLPLFQQPTDPYIPVHQISSNCAPDSSFLWIRIWLPGDEISQIGITSHPSEYKIPRTLQIKRQTQKGPQMKIQDIAYDMPQKDPHYSASGLLVYLHYLKNYPIDSLDKVTITWSLYLGSSQLYDDYGNPMQWTSQPAHTSQGLNSNSSLEEFSRINAASEFQQWDTVLKIMENTSWIKGKLSSYIWLLNPLANSLGLRYLIKQYFINTCH